MDYNNYMLNEKCKNCANFCQYYVKSQSLQFMPVNYGICKQHISKRDDCKLYSPRDLSREKELQKKAVLHLVKRLGKLLTLFNDGE